MGRVSTNISLDADLKKAGQELFYDLGMDLSTAVTIFLKQALRVQGLPFQVTRDVPNADTLAAFDECDDILAHPERYKSYSSSEELMAEVLGNA